MRYVCLVAAALILGSSADAQIQINGSYLNVSRPTGGPVVLGDILELRAVISVPSGITITSLHYDSPLPTGVAYVAGSIKVMTNEGLIVSGLATTGNYTDAVDGDQGNLTGSTISVYMGTGASSSAGGTVIGGSTPPLFYNVASIFMVAFQVKVTGAIASTITTAGAFHYTDTQAENVSVTPMTMIISPAYGCGATGTNYLTFESNGTFGTGSTLNRSTASANVTGFSFTNLSGSTPNDGQYSIVTNTSPTGYTGTTPSSGDKVFGYWDVIGDHTGSSTTTGNGPAASGSTAGYMLAVNATYAPAIVFTASITGLIPYNTYNISFWLYNICPTCGNDPSSGNANGTPGVKPNLAINVNSLNYYSTGEIAYSGKWLQSSFAFVNGGSTTALLEIRNNAPGGGGNDWALDDIQMSNCLTVLPIGLQSFTGRALTEGNLLSWQYAPSPDMARFEIQRSTDGTSFTTIGEADATPDNSGYTFTDDQLPAATQFDYRLQLVTVDGRTTYSPIVVIDATPSAATTVRLWPNPAHASTTLSIQTDQPGAANLTLLDAAGKPVLSRTAQLATGSNSISFLLPTRLPAGIYIVRITTSAGVLLNRLIVD